MKTMQIIIIVSVSVLLSSLASADTPYNHDKWQTLPIDHMFEFEAFITSFDGADDNSGDQDSDKWGIPEWVAFEIRKIEEDHPLQNRPKWTTDPDLFALGIAPDDKTYAVSGVRKIKEVKTDYRFVRGHMCPKDTAERISEKAAHETHTMLNACPQLQWQNNGIWKKLEGLCLDWADKYGSVWVICGPVFFGREPAMWLGQDGEKKAAIPDAFFKIVVRLDGDSVETMAFLIPNILPKSETELNDRLTSIDRIEDLTGLDFLTALDDTVEAGVESKTTSAVDW